MKHPPEAYGAYWSGAVRMAIGVIVVVAVHRGVSPLVGHSEWPAQALGWVVFGLAVFVGAFAVAIGIAIVVRAAVALERSG